MGRILAIDYGKVRTGIAISDEMQIIASGLTTVNTKMLIPFIESYVKKEKVVLFVVGSAKQTNNLQSEIEPFTLDFVKELNKAIPDIPIKRIDERFTSKMAIRTIIDSGAKKKKRQDKSLIDKVSATIILQSYLSSRVAGDQRN